MGLWYAQLGLNFAWSPVMFTLHAIALALLIILALLCVVLSFVIIQWSRDRVAAYLFMPHAASVAHASLLNAAVWHLNSGKYPTF
jgi:benzodiazapine receptor